MQSKEMCGQFQFERKGIQGVRHPKEGHISSHRIDPRFPPSTHQAKLQDGPIPHVHKGSAT